MILHHTTQFGIAERQSRSAPRAEAARLRIEAWLRDRATGLVLTSPGAVAWACGGIAPPVDRTAAVDLTWAVFTPGRAALITTNVEAGRIGEEYDPAAHGFAGFAQVPWYSPHGFVAAAADLAGLAPERLASDGHPAFGHDVSDDLVAMRLALSPAEVADLADLGADAAAALQEALGGWQPGERDTDIQARCAAGLEARGTDAPVLIVGGDDRLERYRHPMAAGVPVRRLVMAVAVARRHGLHVALTRFAAAGPAGGAQVRQRRAVLAIQDAVLAACEPGASYGTALAALAAGYTAAGAEGGWRDHYQGGPIGFAQREFEIAPGQRESRWYGEPIAAGHAIAWNPSLPGGAKAEDTFLVTGGDLRQITSAPGWPAEISDRGTEVPAVLEVGT